MMTHRRFMTIPLLVLSLFSIGNPPPCHARGPQPRSSSDLHSRLNALTGVMVRKIEALPVSKRDSRSPSSSRSIIIARRRQVRPEGVYIPPDYSKPVVLETEGYGAAWPKEREAAKLLNANQVIVEHRYYESSRPKPLDWTHLTSWQAASDHHRIIDLLKKVYPGKWVTSGKSKAEWRPCSTVIIIRARSKRRSPTSLRSFSVRRTRGLDRSWIRWGRIGPGKDPAVPENVSGAPGRSPSLLRALSEKRRLSFPGDLEGILERTVIEFPYAFWSGNRKSDDLPRRTRRRSGCSNT